MKYNVHLYVGARVLIEGIEASDQQEATRKALAQYDPEAFFTGADAREGAVPDESILGALVDEEGDAEFARTKYYPHDDVNAYLQPPDGLDHCLPKPVGAFATNEAQIEEANLILRERNADLLTALHDTTEQLGLYINSAESGKDDDAESAYQHGLSVLKSTAPRKWNLHDASGNAVNDDAAPIEAPTAGTAALAFLSSMKLDVREAP